MKTFSIIVCLSILVWCIWAIWKRHHTITLTIPKRPRIYVAGPYSAGDPLTNTNTAIDVADQIVDLGGDPFIPHLAHYRHARHERPYQFWIDEDLRWLEVCDALFRFPGKSSGAENEIKVMRDTHQRPVFYDLDSLKAWIDEWNGEDIHGH